MKAFEVSFKPKDTTTNYDAGFTYVEVVKNKTHRQLPLCEGEGTFCIVLAESVLEVAQVFPKALRITELRQFGYTVKEIKCFVQEIETLQGDPPPLTEKAGQEPT